MPKKKKQYIDKNDPRTHSFSLVHRSQRDPLAADPEAPQLVLLPKDVGPNEIPKEPVVTADAKNKTKVVDYEAKADLADAGILFDHEEYDYTQHLKVRRPEDGSGDVYEADPKALAKVLEEKGVSLDGDDKTDLHSYMDGQALVLPSDMLASTTEEDIGLLNLAAPHTGPRLDWDPEVIAALDDDYDFDADENALQDDFMSMALADGGIIDGGNEVDYGSDGSWETDDGGHPEHERRDDFDVDQIRGHAFVDDETRTMKSRFTEYSMTSSILTRSEALQAHDDRFEKLYEQYDEEEIGALDDQEETIGGDHTVDMYADVLDEFLGDYKKNAAKEFDKDRSQTTSGIITNILEKTDMGDADTSTVMETLFQPKKEREFDCETILSTRSTLYNHPRRIVEQSKKIKINKKTGLPIEAPAPKADDEADEEEEDDVPGENLGVARSKKETPEEKKARKQAIKDEKRERRVVKKGVKDAFKDEEKRQKKLLSSNPAFGLKIKSLA